jgi:hypothetical protein
MSKEKLSRRDFGKVLCGLSGGAILSTLPKFDIPECFEHSDSCDFIRLNERTKEIMSKVQNLAFDKDGNIVLSDKRPGEGWLSLIPTKRNEIERDKIESVKLHVVHYDGGLRFRANGIERTALNTVWGLNGNDPDNDGYGATTHWCIDNFAIAKNDTKEEGYGVLQTQEASGDPFKPLKGIHVHINEWDDRRLRTAEKFKELGVDSKLYDIVDNEITDINCFSVGHEQIGTKYEKGFPLMNQPPLLQIANNVSLCIATMKQFNLTPWDIIGHNEVQYKSDPGMTFMATLRFLLGVAALQNLIPRNLVFPRNSKEQTYFQKVAKYYKENDHMGNYNDWKMLVGFDDLIHSLDDWENHKYFADKRGFIR